MRPLRLLVFCAVFLAGWPLLPTLAVAGTPRDQGFAPIPAGQTGGQRTGLQLRIVRYQGGTNGQLTVEVRNPSDRPVQFSAQGLYFVPQQAADRAPQRLGAVGPFEIQTGQAGAWQRRDDATIEAGATRTVRLDVYCIDSHRPSPDEHTSFRMAKERAPRALAEGIEKRAKAAADSLGGVSTPAAKGTVQSTVWEVRNQRWIKLDGEGAQEADKRDGQAVRHDFETVQERHRK